MKKTELVLGLLIVVFGIGLFVLNRRASEQIVPARPQPVAPPPATALDVPLPSLSFVKSAPRTRTNTPRARPRQIPTPAQAQTNQPADELQDPEARQALALVGVDGQADAYWLDAIFDPSLPDNERADLMEDLNEVGFDDPENLTADDLPIILNRLELIDAVLPNADDFMSPHLIEAQKDLSNMLVTATSRQ